MKALIRKSFPYGGRYLIAGAVEEIDDAAFAGFKRERLVTDAPQEVSVPAVAEIETAPTPTESAQEPKAGKHPAKPRHK